MNILDLNQTSKKIKSPLFADILCINVTWKDTANF